MSPTPVMVSTGKGGAVPGPLLTKAIEQKLCTDAQLRDFASQEYAAVAKLLKVGEDLLLPAIREVKLQEISGQDLLAIPASKYATALQLKTAQQRQFLTDLLNAVRDIGRSCGVDSASSCSSWTSTSTSPGLRLGPRSTEPPSYKAQQAAEQRFGSADGTSSRPNGDASAKTCIRDGTASSGREHGRVLTVSERHEGGGCVKAGDRTSALRRKCLQVPRVPGLRQGLQAPEVHRGPIAPPRALSGSAAGPAVESLNVEELQADDDTSSLHKEEEDRKEDGGFPTGGHGQKEQHARGQPCGGGRTQKKAGFRKKPSTAGAAGRSTGRDSESRSEEQERSLDGITGPKAETGRASHGGRKPERGQSPEKTEGLVRERPKQANQTATRANVEKDDVSASGGQPAAKCSEEGGESEERCPKSCEVRGRRKRLCSAASAAEKAGKSLLARITTASQEEKVRMAQVQKRLFYVCGERTAVDSTEEKAAQRSRQTAQVAAVVGGSETRPCRTGHGGGGANDRERAPGTSAAFPSRLRDTERRKTGVDVSSRRRARDDGPGSVRERVLTATDEKAKKSAQAEPPPATGDGVLNQAKKRAEKRGSEETGDVHRKRKRVVTPADTEKEEEHGGAVKVEAQTDRNQVRLLRLKGPQRENPQGRGSRRVGRRPAERASTANSSQGKEERGSRKIAGGVLSCSGCLKGGGTDDLAELCCRVCCTLPDAWLRFERSPPDLEEISHLVVPLEQERPTLKVLFVLATGGYLLTPSFVTRADEEEVWPRSLGPFESLNFPTHGHRRVIPPPLRGRRVALAGNFPTNKGSLTRKTLGRLVELCGAVLMNTTEREPSSPEFLVCPADFDPVKTSGPSAPSKGQQKSQEKGRRLLAKGAERRLSITAAQEHCEGETTEKDNSEQEERPPERVEVVTPQWVIECIRTWTLDPPRLHEHERATEICRFFGFAPSASSRPRSGTSLDPFSDSTPPVAEPPKKKVERALKSTESEGGKDEKKEASELPARQLLKREDVVEGGTDDPATKENGAKGKKRRRRGASKTGDKKADAMDRGLSKSGKGTEEERSSVVLKGDRAQMPLKAKQTKETVKNAPKREGRSDAEEPAQKQNTLEGSKDGRDEQAVEDHSDGQPRRQKGKSLVEKKTTEGPLSGKGSKRQTCRANGRGNPCGTSPAERVEGAEDEKEEDEEASREEQEEAEREPRPRTPGEPPPKLGRSSRLLRKSGRQEQDAQKEGGVERGQGKEKASGDDGRSRKDEDEEVDTSPLTEDGRAPATNGDAAERKEGRAGTSRRGTDRQANDRRKEGAKQTHHDEGENLVSSKRTAQSSSRTEQREADTARKPAGTDHPTRARLRKLVEPSTSLCPGPNDTAEGEENEKSKEKTPKSLLGHEEARGRREQEDTGGTEESPRVCRPLPDTRKLHEREDQGSENVKRAPQLTACDRSSPRGEESGEEKGRDAHDYPLCVPGFDTEGAGEQARDEQEERVGFHWSGTAESRDVVGKGEEPSGRLSSFVRNTRDPTVQEKAEGVDLFAVDEDDRGISLVRPEEECGSQGESEQNQRRRVAGEKEVDESVSDASDEFELGPSQLAHFYPPDLGSSESEEEEEEQDWQRRRRSLSERPDRRTARTIHEDGGVGGLPSAKLPEEEGKRDSSSQAARRRQQVGGNGGTRGEEAEEQSGGEEEDEGLEGAVRPHTEGPEQEEAKVDEGQGEERKEDSGGHVSKRVRRVLSEEEALGNRSGSNAESSRLCWEVGRESGRSQGSWERENETEAEEV